MATLQVLASLVLSSICLGQKYVLNRSYSGKNFFDGFEFLEYQQCVQTSFTDYVANESEAYQLGIINTTDDTVYLGVDSTTKFEANSTIGRKSLCIGTKTRYNNGLFILNASHMPFGCGVWPSWWQTDGAYAAKVMEYDTIEGINLFNDDWSTLHVAGNCSFEGISVNMTGSFKGYNCGINKTTEGGGCTVEPNNPKTYGKVFNNNGGGIFAHDNDPILGKLRVWFWTQDEAPQDIKNKTPDPNTWGIPYGEYPFGSWCPSELFNTAKQLRFDIYFCGWSGQQSWFQQCQTQVTNGLTCQEWVNTNPSYFKDAYWIINYMDVYQRS